MTHRTLKQDLRKWVDYGAAIVGVLGIPFVLREGFQFAAGSEAKELGGFPIWVWTTFGTLVTFAVVVALFLRHLLHKGYRREDRLNGLIHDLREQMSDGRSRHLQKAAFESLSLVYGYHIEKFVYDFTIYGSGEEIAEGESHHRIEFRAGRRNLSRWSRTVDSTLVPQNESNAHPRMGSIAVSTESMERSPRTPNQLVEVFHFLPTVQHKDGIVALEFSSEQKKGTFLACSPNSKDRPTDWISFAPREPIKTLVLIAQFRGMEPDDFYANAFFNPAQFQLEQEALDSQFLLRLERRAGHLTAILEVPYPVIGVTYRLEWKLPKKGQPFGAKSSAVASGAVGAAGNASLNSGSGAAASPTPPKPSGKVP